MQQIDRKTSNLLLPCPVPTLTSAMHSQCRSTKRRYPNRLPKIINSRATVLYPPCIPLRQSI